MLIYSTVSISSLLVLIAMVSLRWFDCRLSGNSVCHRIYKKSNGYLDKQFSFLREKSEKYKRKISLFVSIKRLILFFSLKMYSSLISFLRKKNDKFGKFLRRVSLKKGGESVSEYMKNISDYKNVSEK